MLSILFREAKDRSQGVTNDTILLKIGISIGILNNIFIHAIVTAEDGEIV
jgi:hypothetical protein